MIRSLLVVLLLFPTIAAAQQPAAVPTAADAKRFYDAGVQAYDDGQYQEFWMTVKSEQDGSPLTVRSVRNCTPGTIEFFQPEPPAFLRHHGGIWRFKELGEATEVQITHVWNLHPERAAEIFPPNEEGSTEERVTKTLAGHSRITLQTWQSILEEAAA